MSNGFVSMMAGAGVPCACEYTFTSPLLLSVTVNVYWTSVVAAENTQ